MALTIATDNYPGRKIFDVLREAAGVLKEAGIDSSRLEAEILLAKILACSRAQLYARLREALPRNLARMYKALIQKRRNRIPLQYLTGHTEFMSLDFLVKKGIFIPRQETELVVETVLDRAGTYKKRPLTIIDIGTGSGCIAISIAVYLRDAEVYASDVSLKALRLARENASMHSVKKRVHLFKGNLFEGFEGLGLEGKADFVVSNPPYVAEEELCRLQPEVRVFESRQALVGREKGLEFYRRIVAEAIRWLAQRGIVVLEVGDRQSKQVKRIIERQDCYCDIEILRDLQGVERVVVARLKRG